MDQFEKEVREDITDIKVAVQRIETKLDEQPKQYDGRFKDHDRRIVNLETNQNKFMWAIIMLFITALGTIILK